MVAFSPGSKLVASDSSYGTVKLWDAAKGAPQQTLEGHSSDVKTVVFSPDGKLVASGIFALHTNDWDRLFHACLSKSSQKMATITSVIVYEIDAKHCNKPA